MDGDAEAWDGLLRALGDRPRKALDRALQQLRVVKQHARRACCVRRSPSFLTPTSAHSLKNGTTPAAEPADEPADDGHQVVVRRPRLMRHVAVPALWWSRRHRDLMLL